MAVDVSYEKTARYYDAAYEKDAALRRDAAFYAALAKEAGGPVLEMGCGTGRVLLPIAHEGIECAGIDPSPGMLDVFRAKEGADKVELHCTAMQAFDLGAHRFQFVFSAFRAFQHLLTVDDQLDCLTLVRAHLHPGGIFAMDVFNPSLERTAKNEEPEAIDLEFSMGDHTVKRFCRCTRDRAAQVASIDMRYVEYEQEKQIEEVDLSFTMRWLFHYELEHLLYRAGFGEVEIFGDFDRSPVGRDSPELVVIAS